VKDLYLCRADQSGKEEARLKPLLNLHKSCGLRKERSLFAHQSARLKPLLSTIKSCGLWKERRSRFQPTFSVLSKGFIPAEVIVQDPYFCYDERDRFYWQQTPYRFPQFRSSMTGRQEQAFAARIPPHDPVQSSAD
jgi:hypothetical protein